MLNATLAKMFGAPKALLLASSQTPSQAAGSSAHVQQMPAQEDGSTVQGGNAAQGASTRDITNVSSNEDENRMHLPQHDLLLFSMVAQQDSLARAAITHLNPRIATSTEELNAHFETERFKLIVVECAQQSSELVQSAIDVHRRIPPEDGSSLIAFKPGPDTVLDVLRYTPSASAFAFLAARPHQLRAHILELLTP